MLGAMSWPSPTTPLSFTSQSLVGLIFSWWIRRRWEWMDYITAAASDSELMISTLIIFLAIMLPEVEVPNWWGNVGVFEAMSALGSTIRKEGC